MLIHDVISVHPDATDSAYTHSQCALLARIEVSSVGSQPAMIEWSVSPQGSSPGQAMMEPIWRETMHDDIAIFTTKSSHIQGGN